MSKIRWLFAVFFAIAIIPTLGFAQDRGTVTGTVTEGQTQRPLAGVQVSIAGTTLGTITNAQGRFLLTNVPAGAREVRAQLIGYGTQTQTVTVVAGQSVTANITLAQTAVALDEVVVTGTAGRQERRAQAAVVSTVAAATIVETQPVTNVSEILQARTPGVSIEATSGTSGTAQQIRMRGISSLSLTNEPLVFIDGIRMDSRRTQLYGVGGQQQSRLNDIRPEDIESIEVVKGPAAATLYGADATAGVIQIITKRGRAGTGFTQSLALEYNSIDPNWTPPANFGACTAAQTTARNADGTPTWPACFGQAPGTILEDNPTLRYDVLRTGNMRGINWSGRGGGENYGYFVSLGGNWEDGTLPQNRYDRISGRFNFNFVPNPRLRFEGGLGLIQTTTSLPHNDNNIYGYLWGTMTGDPRTVGTAFDGWAYANRQVDAISAIDNTDYNYRVTPTLSVNYNPTDWFTNRVNLGIDMTREEGGQFWPMNPNQWYGTVALNSGQIAEAKRNRDQITLDYLGNIRTDLSPQISSDLSFGSQVITRSTALTNATGIGLTVNAANAVNAASQRTGGGSFSEERQIGFFGQWQVGLRDRLFVQLAGRVDQASAFGADAPPFFSPKFGVSWVISDEPFWQNVPEMFGSLRLRAAYGTTGRSPSTGALATYSPSPFAAAATPGGPTTIVGSGVVPTNPGNPELRPERGTELEAGFDAGFLGERLGLEVTYFDKTSRDIILARPLAPSAGFGENPLVNIGEMVNRGIEVAANARIIDLPNFGWESRLGFNTLHHEITDLGDVEPFGTLNRRTVGRQAGAFHTRTIREVVTDPARAAQVCRAGQTECAIVADSVEFFGNLHPTFEGTFSNAVTLFRDLRLSGLLEWKTGFHKFNWTRDVRERSIANAEGWVRRNEILSQEERIRRFGPFVTETARANINAPSIWEAYIERADYMRLRELSLTYSLPTTLARQLGGTSASITLAGRNLALWTDYTGDDPEITDAPTADFWRGDLMTLPQPRRWVARVNLQF